MIEVISPGSAVMDRIARYEKYARAGVTEYWIVKPAGQTVEVFVLEGQEYRSLGIFGGHDLLPSLVVPGLPVRVEQFFA